MSERDIIKARVLEYLKRPTVRGKRQSPVSIFHAVGIPGGHNKMDMWPALKELADDGLIKRHTKTPGRYFYWIE